MPGRFQRLLALSLICLLTSFSVRSEAADKWEFPVRFSKEAHGQQFSGRVYVIFSKQSQPRRGPNWFRPEQFISFDVEDWTPGTPIVLNDRTEGLLGYPGPLADMELKGYYAQAVVRFNPWERKIGRAPGNGYSQVIQIREAGKQTELVVDQIVPEQTFQETKWSKLIEVKSKLLSDFYGHDVYQKAAVILPKSYYDEPDRRYPTIYTIPGFGGDHFAGQTGKAIDEKNEGGVEFLRIILDPSCPLGHHVFADSANNGPRGQCLIDEFIPAFDRKFRSIPKPTARFVTGHSSGGWSSLWIQVTYPEHFGGVWSTSPDPVDFRDFQRINLYEPGENMYVDADGKRRPLARVNGQVRLWYQGFADMEWVLGPGGQLHSFEAVFSPRGEDGKPLLIWNRKTGVVDTKVTKTWEKYDIRLILERNWKELEPKLKGKLHVYMGDVDTFYLEGATILLKKSVEETGSDAVVKIMKGHDHSSILSRTNLRREIRAEMAAAFLKNHPDQRR